MATKKVKTGYEQAKADFKASKADAVGGAGVQACPQGDALMDWTKEQKGDAVHITGVCRNDPDHNIDRYGRGEA